MTAEACASLLKILEEPPRLYFILLTAGRNSYRRRSFHAAQRFTLSPERRRHRRLLMEKEGLARRGHSCCPFEQGPPGWL